MRHDGLRDNETTHRLSVTGGNSSWEILLQSGAIIPCVVNVPLTDMARNGFGLSDELLARIDVFFLDGKPVDNPESAIVGHGARLALAAGLPGIAGLAMKSGSPLRGLRPGITHSGSNSESAPPCPGHVELVLYSLTLPLLGGHFLRKGVLLPAGKLVGLLRESMLGDCALDEEPLEPEDVKKRIGALPPDALVLLSL
jgi:hypothetical protein